MLITSDRRRYRDMLIPIAVRSGMKDVASIDWGNRMLVIHFMQKALEVLEDPSDEVRSAIMLVLADCNDDRGLSHEAVYWYQKCLQECAFVGRPLEKLHVQGHLLASLTDARCLPDAEQLLGEIAAEPPGIGKDDAIAYSEHLRALALYITVKSRSLDGDASQVKPPADALLGLCASRRECLLMQKLRCGVLEVLAAQSEKAGDFADAISLYRQAAASALSCGRAQKAASYRKAISAAYEAMGNLPEAFQQFQKYYRMSGRINRKKSEEFSDYLLAIHNLNETEQEIDSLREMKEYLRLKRNTDPLTGVYNQLFWDEALEQIAASAAPGTVFSVPTLDIDAFKAYNGTYGHLEGDRALKTIGSVLKGCLRANADVLARFGSDEFRILVEGMDEKESKRLAERIRISVKDNAIRFGGGTAPTLSIGLATGTIGWGRGLQCLMDDADAALYYAKTHGKDQSAHMADIKELDEND